jgi:hypothetical protein
VILHLSSQDTFDPLGTTTTAMSEDPFSPHDDVSIPFLRMSNYLDLSSLSNRTALALSQTQLALVGPTHSHSVPHFPTKTRSSRSGISATFKARRRMERVLQRPVGAGRLLRRASLVLGSAWMSQRECWRELLGRNDRRHLQSWSLVRQYWVQRQL